MQSVWSILADPVVLAAVSAVAAFAAVPIAVAALISSHRTALRMVEIEETRDRQAERQAMKANFSANLERHDRSGRVLIIKNHGPGTARNIKVSLNGRPMSENSSVYSDDVPREAVLSPGGYLKFDVIYTLDSPILETIRIDWEDESGESGVHQSGL